MIIVSLYYMKRIQVRNEVLLLCFKVKIIVSYVNLQCIGKVGDVLQKVVFEVVKGIFFIYISNFIFCNYVLFLV